MAVKVQQVDLEVIEGNDPSVTLTIKADGAVVNLAASTIEVFIKDDVHKADTDASTVKLSSAVSGEVDITDAANGKAQVNFLAAHFPDRKPRRYRVDVIKNARRQTYGYGNVYIVNV